MDIDGEIKLNIFNIRLCYLSDKREHRYTLSDKAQNIKQRNTIEQLVLGGDRKPHRTVLGAIKPRNMVCEYKNECHILLYILSVI